MARPDAGRTPYHHGDLRRALLDAVLAQVREGGPEAVSLRAAARSVGVSPGATFRHFADKRAVMTALAAAGFRALGERMEREAAAAATSMGRFGAIGRAYLLWALENPDLFRVMFRADLVDEDDPALVDAGARARASLAEDLPAALPAGVPEAEVRRRALLAWGAVHGVATLTIEGALREGPSRPRMPPPDELGRTLALLEAVIAAPSTDAAD